MSALAQVIAAAIAIGSLVFVVVLVRRRRLKERYAVIWLAVALGMVALVVFRPLLDRISEALGIASGTSTLFLLAILVVLVVLLQLSASLTRLEDQVRDVAEAVALITPSSAETIQQPDHGHDEPLPESEDRVDR